VIALALLLSAAGLTVEALIFRGLFDIGRELDLPEQRLGAMLLLVAFVGVMLLLEVPTVSLVRRMGRRLEARLRELFLRRIPRLSDAYFSSRLTSDMAERSHSIHAVRDVTELGEGALRALFSLLLTGAGLVWLDPPSLPAVLIAIAVSLGLPLLVQPLMRERDLRVRSHQGALTRFYLDALLGVIPLRTHGASGAVREEHEQLVSEWLRAQGSLLRLAIPLNAVIGLVGMAIAGALLLGYVQRSGERLDLLLFVYWALSIPALGARLASIAAQYPVAHNLTQRLLEPIAAPTADSPAEGGSDEPRASDVSAPIDGSAALDPAIAADVPAPFDGAEPLGDAVTNANVQQSRAGVALAFREVSLKLAGRQVLEQVELEISPREHVAVVGPSGSGKSSLVGLLLGWYQPARGAIVVDGQLLDGARLHRLRQQTAWVDPAVQLWNRSVLDNLRYGAPEGADLPFARAIEQADLHGVLQTLPGGLQGHLGEGGALVSGGEGQRVRLARALLRPGVRLAILDEPFRGLDRDKRRTLMNEVRQWWRSLTLICISHDIEQTIDFDRVFVLRDGCVVEQGRPPALVTNKRSIYRSMMQAEQAVRRGLWEGDTWRRLWLERGALRELEEETR
jgi:ABC-type multidrug transport system fused ATPase/permease subunit